MIFFKNKSDFVYSIIETDNKSNPHYKMRYLKKDDGILILGEFLGFPNDKSQDKYIGTKTSLFVKYPAYLI